MIRISENVINEAVKTVSNALCRLNRHVSFQRMIITYNFLVTVTDSEEGRNKTKLTFFRYAEEGNKLRCPYKNDDGGTVMITGTDHYIMPANNKRKYIRGKRSFRLPNAHTLYTHPLPAAGFFFIITKFP